MEEGGTMARTAGSVQQIEASPEEVGLSSEGMARLTRHVQAYVDAGKFPGAISIVQRRGKVVHFQTYGRRDVEAGTPVEPETIFRIYSMTKPIVSVGLMTLYEEGRFQLDDPVSQYIPLFRGLKVLTSGTGAAPLVREPAREMTVKLGTLPLKCDPGAQFNYGISTDVVGYLCEVLSGQRLDAFLRERILS